MMGRYEYAVVPLGDEAYLDDARQALGDLFDIAVNDCGLHGQEAADAFIASGIARQFERHNPVFIAGKSGSDLVQLMLPYAGRSELLAGAERLERTPDWWVGWALAYFQFVRGGAYRDVLDRVPYDEVRAMYHPLHEAPESKFVDVLEGLLRERRGPTKLKIQREAAGLSQSQLAAAAGVGLRSIQMYEQRNKSVGKAQAITLMKLAQALHCEIADLVEAA